MAVRHPAKRRSSSCSTGILPPIGLDRPTSGFEGRLDFDFQQIMVVAPHVESYFDQPETFHFEVDGVPRKYTPDGLAITDLGRIYFEVKPAKKLARSPDLEGKLDAIIRECAARSASFSIMTEAEIRIGKLLHNSGAVWSAAQAIDPLELSQTCRLLRMVRFPATAAQLSNLGPRRWFRIRALLGHRYLATDLALPFSEQTILVPGRRAVADAISRN